jgi:hypothetical protein
MGFRRLEMEKITALLPVTVLAAVILFALKEVLEGIRRWRSNGRKLRAFKLLLARECELNRWAVERLRDALNAMETDAENDIAKEYTIERRASGMVIFKRGEVGDDDWGSWPLPEVRLALISDNLLEVATLDKSLFEILESTYDGVIDLKHVRDSLIDFLESEDEHVKAHLDGFPDYGLRELADIQVELERLYQLCTGEQLASGRVR